MVNQEEIHKIARSEDANCRKDAVNRLRSNFVSLPNKKQAWDDLMWMTQDMESYVRKKAVDTLGTVFIHIPDKKKAWKDLIRLAQHKDSYVQRRIISELGIAFINIHDRKQAWKDLHLLIINKEGIAPLRAAKLLCTIFIYIPFMKQAWKDLHLLTMDKQGLVRYHSTNALIIAFPYIPAKKQAWNDLIKLTLDDDIYVRVFANHSLGKASIFKATKAVNEKKFRKELEDAIEFFEKSLKEAPFDFNPAEFCLPFYRSFYKIIFRETEPQDEVETDIQKYFAEARSAVRGSESKETLLEAIKTLENALREVQEVRTIGEMKSELDDYRRHCEHAVSLLNITEQKAPGATKLIKKGLPIIDERIKGIIAEIQEKSKALCKQMEDTPLEELGKKVNNAGQDLLKIRDPIALEKSIENMQVILSAICSKIPEEEKGEACELLKKAKDEQYVEDKMNLHNLILGKISSQIGEWKNRLCIINNPVFQNSNVQIGNDTRQKINSSINHYKEIKGNLKPKNA